MSIQEFYSFINDMGKKQIPQDLVERDTRQMLSEKEKEDKRHEKNEEIMKEIDNISLGNGFRFTPIYNVIENELNPNNKKKISELSQALYDISEKLEEMEW